MLAPVLPSLLLGSQPCRTESRSRSGLGFPPFAGRTTLLVPPRDLSHTLLPTLMRTLFGGNRGQASSRMNPSLCSRHPLICLFLLRHSRHCAPTVCASSLPARVQPREKSGGRLWLVRPPYVWRLSLRLISETCSTYPMSDALYGRQHLYDGVASRWPSHRRTSAGSRSR